MAEAIDVRHCGACQLKVDLLNEQPAMTLPPTWAFKIVDRLARRNAARRCLRLEAEAGVPDIFHDYNVEEAARPVHGEELLLAEFKRFGLTGEWLLP